MVGFRQAGVGMFEARRGDCAERTALDVLNGYVEIDPTGRYGRFDEVLGKGAMKTVYKALDEVNGTEVAWNQASLCNVMQSPEALQRMYSEVHLLSSLQHESIIRYHTSWIDVENRTFNFITEMFTSGTLREYRHRYPQVDIRAIKSWARQILNGLAYLHGHDPLVIHRDIKCDNIFINGHLGQVKIGDFGLAAVLQSSQSAHSVIGTPEFMAPELYEEEYNELVDIYSFGMCVLEMLTSEYPYSECFNPAQIYKKVTKGKLPDAFHCIQDPEAKRFISRCLETVSERPSAKEILLDPFLTLDDHNGPLLTLKISPAHADKDIRLQGHDHLHLPEACDLNDTASRTDMTITGKMNLEDDMIFLKVQIADKEGHVRNISFPFDIVSDTPIDVANEMVKELEITDREPLEIAEMISEEITALVPDWKAKGGPNYLHHVYNYEDDSEDGCNHPFYNLSSPTSSQGSVFRTGHYLGVFDQQQHPNQEEWFQGGLYSDDDDMSSTHSCKYSATNYTSGNEQESKISCHHTATHSHKLTKFCPGVSPGEDTSLANEFHEQCSIPSEPSSTSSVKGGRKPVNNRQLMRNRSMVDMRSHLLHRNLVEQLKKRLFKMVGVVENIGFQMPCYGSHKALPSSQGDYRKQKQGHAWGRRYIKKLQKTDS